MVERCQGYGCSNFVQIGTASVPTYSDNGVLANSQNSYRLRAVNSAGNLSAYSSVISATTPSDSTAPSPSPSPVPSPAPPGVMTFKLKCAQQGVLGCYGFDSASNVRDLPGVPAPYPLKYGGWSGTGPCASAGLGNEYDITRDRNFGNPAGSRELNAVVKVQNGVCYYPTVDNSEFFEGTGALRIEVPSNADSGNGGYFDSTFQGVDMTFPRVNGPWNRGTATRIWHSSRLV